MSKITDFKDEYLFLGNYYEAPITYQGVTYSNNESAFQAQKVVSDELKQKFKKLPPKDAKTLGNKVELRSDWEAVKVDIMKDIVYFKFTQNDNLKEKLLATGNAEITKGKDVNNEMSPCNVLMEVRDKIRKLSESKGNKFIYFNDTKKMCVFT